MPGLNSAMRNVFPICLMLLFFTLCRADGLHSREINLYVSPAGSNESSGRTPDKPFATLDRARDEIRSIKKEDGDSGPVTVFLRGGTYELEKPFLLDERDSGSSGSPVSYTAFEGETPVICGGRKISGKWSRYNDDVWVLEIPEVKQGRWYFRQLFAGDSRLIRARTPNEGFFLIGDSVSELEKNEMPFAGSDIQEWKNLNDSEVVLFHSWNESRLRIAGIDEEEKKAVFTGPVGRKLNKGRRRNRYYVENTLEGIDMPGEWYLDRQAGRLYLYPQGNIKEISLRAPRLKQLVVLKGGMDTGSFVEYVSFEGLTFTEADWSLPDEGFPSCGDVGDIIKPSAVTFHNARYCTFSGNTVKHTGTYALEITGFGNRIIGNEIYDTGSGGIISRSYHPERNEISRNHIHDCGKVYFSAVGINIDDGSGTFANNHIHDIAHSGIYARHWATKTQEIERRNQEQGLLIEYNEIHDVMKSINDGAGIFVRDSDIIIRNNLIYNVKSYGRGTPGWGIYLGCETRNTRVYNNLVYNTTEGLHIWYGNRNNVIENNIFVDGDLSLVKANNANDKKHEHIKIVRNIFCYFRRDIDLFRIDGKHSLPEISDYNLFWNPFGCIWMSPVIWGLEGIEYFEKWQNEGFDVHSKVADPEFVDFRNNDFTLKPGSPAFDLGFKAIDFSNVGLRGSN